MIKMGKKSLLVIMLTTVSAMAMFAKTPSDEEQIKRVINEAYIDGIQNWGDPEVIRQGFVPEFVMLMLVDNEIRELPLETWIENGQKQREANPEGPPHPARVKYLDIDVTGTAAIVKLELYRQGQKQFTDYLALYRFAEGWKIAGKTFYRH